MKTKKIEELKENEYYSIGKISDYLNIKPHVLRYWETEFKTLKPNKNNSGQRRYALEDIKRIQKIKKLLYEDGFTIEGAKKLIGDPQKELGFEFIIEKLNEILSVAGKYK